jgi:hypothetical protein
MIVFVPVSIKEIVLKCFEGARFSLAQTGVYIEAAERVCQRGGHKSDTVIMLKRKSRLAVINN